MADIIGEVTTVALDFTKDLISDPFGTIEGVASGVFGDYYDQTKDNDLFQSKYEKKHFKRFFVLRFFATGKINYFFFRHS